MSPIESKVSLHYRPTLVRPQHRQAYLTQVDQFLPPRSLQSIVFYPNPLPLLPDRPLRPRPFIFIPFAPFPILVRFQYIHTSRPHQSREKRVFLTFLSLLTVPNNYSSNPLLPTRPLNHRTHRPPPSQLPLSANNYTTIPRTKTSSLCLSKRSQKEPSGPDSHPLPTLRRCSQNLSDRFPSTPAVRDHHVTPA